MPAIRAIAITPSTLTITDRAGTKVLLASAIPSSQNTIAKVENYVNNTWVPANITDYQCRIHIFTLTPLLWTVGTWNIGETINNNWWE